jgi:uncharacterized protein YbcI
VTSRDSYDPCEVGCTRIGQDFLIEGTTDTGERPAGGRLNAAVARAVVHAHNEYRGRGPTRAQAFFNEQMIVVLMEDTMTTAERSLVRDGRNDVVFAMRRQMQSTMRADMIASIEDLTGRKVIAFMSANHTAPDYAAELFVLDASVAAKAAAVPDV